MDFSQPGSSVHGIASATWLTLTHQETSFSATFLRSWGKPRCLTEDPPGPKVNQAGALKLMVKNNSNQKAYFKLKQLL